MNDREQYARLCELFGAGSVDLPSGPFGRYRIVFWHTDADHRLFAGQLAAEGDSAKEAIKRVWTNATTARWVENRQTGVYWKYVNGEFQKYRPTWQELDREW